MRRAILIVTVMIAAVLVGTSAVAYAKQSDATSPKMTSPDTTSSETTGPITTENHSWGNYHWARTSNPFTLKLGDNLTANWKPYLGTTSTDWSADKYAADTTTPTVSSVAPPDGATGVALAVDVEATFSEAVKPATVSADTVELDVWEDGYGWRYVPTSVTLSSDGKTATLNPSSALKANTTYTPWILGGPVALRTRRATH